MNIDKFVDTIMNLQLVQFMTQSLGNIMHGPSVGNSTSYYLAELEMQREESEFFEWLRSKGL